MDEDSCTVYIATFIPQHYLHVMCFIDLSVVFLQVYLVILISFELMQSLSTVERCSVTDGTLYVVHGFTLTLAQAIIIMRMIICAKLGDDTRQ